MAAQPQVDLTGIPSLPDGYTDMLRETKGRCAELTECEEEFISREIYEIGAMIRQRRIETGAVN